MRLTRELGSILTLLAVAASLPASAQIALTFTGGTNSSSTVMRGWEFTTTAPVTIGALGWWDQGNDGLANTHQVGIWNSATSALVVSATVASGTTDQSVSSFRFDTGLTGTPTLPAGTYIMGGLSTSADLVAAAIPSGSVSFAPGITYGSNESGSGSFSLPSTAIPGADVGTFGPNFYVGALPTVLPEPGAIGLLIGSTASVGLFLLRRNRRRK